MRYVCLILSLVAVAASGPGRSGEPTSRSATRPATTRPSGDAATTQRVAGQTTSRPYDDLKTKRLVRTLVAELGSPAYRVREAAQKKLAKLGEKAMPHLVEFIGSADLEVANRIAALIRRPNDPHVRIEVAVRLLATGDPDWMEPAVHMLFETPRVDCDLFLRRTAKATGRERATFRPVAEQLATWKRITEFFYRRQEQLLQEQKAEAARKDRELHDGSKLYQAEAAYWSAVEAMEDYAVPKPARRSPATRPAGG